jgi:hypothetical protein
VEFGKAVMRRVSWILWLATALVPLLGDSILDNAPLVPGRRAVVDHVRNRLPRASSHAR